MVITALGVFVVAVLTWRARVQHPLAAPHLEQRVLILGTGAAARVVAREIRLQQDFAIPPRRVRRGARRPGGSRRRRPRLGWPTSSRSSACSGGRPHRRRAVRPPRPPADRRSCCSAKLSGVRVEDAATTYERLTGKIFVDDMKPSWLVFSDGFRASRASRASSSGCWISALALIGFLAAAPLMAATALAVLARLGGPGPLLPGARRGERPRFTLYKFRSMRTDAERGTPVWARDKDDRVTRVGRFIRHDAARRAAAALERPARRHELRRPAARSARISWNSSRARFRSTGSGTP